MSYRRRKDLTDCMARGKMRLSIRPYYYDVFLWNHVDALKACMDDFGRAPLQVEKDRDGEPGGLCCHAAYQVYEEGGEWKEKWPRKLEEIHFLRDQWDMEVVAHECEHAKTNVCRMLHINPLNDIEEEERAAYLLGEMVNAVYCWLWKVNAHGMHTEGNGAEARHNG